MDTQKTLEITKDPKKALDFARVYAKEGKYEEALEMHQWFHVNALSIKRSLYGVRLGGALSSWIRLGENYPKAKQRLIEIRDEELAKIKNGDWKFENYHDIEAISRVLKESNMPVKIFKIISEKEKDVEKVMRCFDITLKYLVDEGEVELCRKYFDDPLKYVSKYIGYFKDNEKSSKEHILKMENSKIKEEFVKGTTEVHKNIYIKSMNLLVRVLRMLDRNKEIEQVYMAGKGIVSDEEYEKILVEK